MYGRQTVLILISQTVIRNIYAQNIIRPIVYPLLNEIGDNFMDDNVRSTTQEECNMCSMKVIFRYSSTQKNRQTYTSLSICGTILYAQFWTAIIFLQVSKNIHLLLKKNGTFNTITVSKQRWINALLEKRGRYTKY